MSRLQSQAVAGFFATPPRVVTAVARLLAAERGGAKRRIRLLDPCCGEGRALATVAAALGAESYGVELEEGRAEASRTRLDRVLCTSAFTVRLAGGGWSGLWLNPPYDQDQDHGRLEHGFLVTLSRALCPGGVLLYLIPQHRLAVSARYLAAHYRNHTCYRFPDPEFAAFRQVVLLATKREQAVPDPEAQTRIETWATTALPILPDAPTDGVPYQAPALPAAAPLFGALNFAPDEAAKEARRVGVWTQARLTEQLWPAEAPPLQPLMPLRQGHLALLIAAGMLDNVVLRDRDRTLLIKGQTRKRFVEMPGSDDETLVEREVIQTSVVTLDLATGEIERIEQAGSVAGTTS